MRRSSLVFSRSHDPQPTAGSERGAPPSRSALRLWVAWLLGAAAMVFAVPGIAWAAPDGFGLGSGADGALTVSGTQTVNDYADLSEDRVVGDTVVRVGPGQGGLFAAGDLILVYQVTGLGSVTSGDQTPVDLALEDAGRWEFARVQSRSGRNLTLTAGLANAYIAAQTQVVRVPEYTSLTVDPGGVLQAGAWNGSRGGILAVLVDGAIVNNGTISANAAGFRGGVFRDGPTNDDCTDPDEAFPDGIDKGEGLSGQFGPSVTGLGNLANGAGGGVCHNSGGGGGGLGGQGGVGGNQWENANAGPIDNGGLGGSAIVLSPVDRLSLGGGGGSGHGNNDVSTSGVAGGGIVFLRGRSLSGTGVVTANGASQTVIAGNDAGGGGGAGGLVFVQVLEDLVCGGIAADGGSGGSVTTGNRHGPGGGGGGGIIRLEGDVGACSTSVQGGANGVWRASSSGTPEAYGSEPGADGVVTTGLYGKIELADDVGGVASGAAGGTAVNVLANDQLNGAPINVADVTLSIADAGGLTGVSVATNGDLAVPAGTPAGTYDVVYEVCQDAVPGNCDTATAEVTVGEALLAAIADSGTVLSGAAGGTAVNVLGNDTLDGAPVDAADVTVAVDADGGLTGVTIDALGNLAVPPGTPGGTYVVVYEMCEILNPLNCDTATAEITVGEAVLVAVSDLALPPYVSGSSGGTAVNVLSNDTLDGAPVNASDVSVSVSNDGGMTGVSIAANGDLQVPSGTPAGTYNVTYEVCEDLNPGNCDSTTASVRVVAGDLVAVADTGSVGSGAVGGVAVNVLDNDTLDGVAVDPADVTVSVDSDGGLTGVSVDGSGNLVVPAGTSANTYTVVYEVCEDLNAGNCATAPVSVTVSPATLVVVGDTGSVGSGAAGGVAVNVLTNDLVDGATPDPSDVTLSLDETDGLGTLSFDGSGNLVVGPGTAAGSYNLVYRLCETLNPTNCGTASISLSVGTAALVAVADTGSVGSGAAGGVAVNVLGNDTLDGDPVDPSDVTVSVDSDGGLTGVSVDGLGNLVVPAGTSANTYTVVYEVCEDLNPGNCATAPVEVEVGFADLVATNDNGFVSSGAVGGTAVNVLANDTLDGVAVDPGDVTLTLTDDGGVGGASLSSDGNLIFPAGVTAGPYTLTYEVCEDLNGTDNCATATVSVTVSPASLVVNGDAGSVSSGAAGGVAVNVLTNDLVDGATPAPGDVTLSLDETDGLGTLSFDGSGNLVVGPGTAAGSYSLVYRLCESLNPTNCGTASINLTVGAALLVANPDVGSVGSGASGGVAVNVLANDTLDGVPVDPSSVTATVTANGGLTGASVDSSGNLVVPAGTSANTYTVVYEVCENLNPTNCDTAPVEVEVGLATLLVVDDVGTIPSGRAGGTVPGLLANDLLDGVAVDPADVSVSIFDEGGLTGVTVQPDGTLVVPAGTAADTYVVTYEVCENLNPTNCGTGEVTVTVAPPVLVAVDDEVEVPSGNLGGTVGNVFGNDTLDTEPALPGELSGTVSNDGGLTGVTVTTDGGVVVPAGTAAGTYDVVVEVCEVLNPSNCDTSTVEVTVGAGTLVANPDVGSVGSGLAGGTAVNVLSNDTLDGVAVDPADVTLDLVDDAGTGATLGASGALVIQPGTAANTYVKLPTSVHPQTY